ncbi:CBL-interacting serine/threonine protein kinase, putative [Entamoeba dispar SAW760]|uniref:CBL-interacting serine/threonine protein kinase, putative n=1 Tax=Entamoeba dispar (strain ATCC PRA-260 / SAW760) TaxID=370354 RepID=B0ENT1_ENTDS|nr:CBL-interacting serine/threonine protein kinase, putative [Entamoeba dispar SAW760]EDR23818.1 CBL-interacting serine/threonine protein kinase, putative [Entamoeba dispar SAW760]|eukprot:EDR23818.1 CBL-interacting serine/threonine protein kinase, putative [Entamoeba dispar SAW760]
MSATPIIETIRLEKVEEETKMICFSRRQNCCGAFQKENINEDKFEIGKGNKICGPSDAKAIIELINNQIIMTKKKGCLKDISKKLKEGENYTIGENIIFEFFVITKETFNKGIEINKRYVFDKEIGSGSFSHVYLARDKIDNQQLVIKTLKKEIINNQIYFHQFEQEISIIKKIKHPFIISYYNDYSINNNKFLVLEYAPNTLISYLNKQKSKEKKYTDLSICERIFKELCCAVQFLQKEFNLIHRDIKCENILINENGHCKLTDFGLCITVNDWEHEKIKKGGIGTPEYLAPEVRTTPAYYSFKSDCWSVGCVLYCLITGNFYKLSYNKTIFDEIKTSNSNYNMLTEKGKMLLEEDLEKRPTMINFVSQFSYFNDTERECIKYINSINEHQESTSEALKLNKNKSNEFPIKRLSFDNDSLTPQKKKRIKKNTSFKSGDVKMTVLFGQKKK